MASQYELNAHRHLWGKSCHTVKTKLTRTSAPKIVHLASGRDRI